jgi:hypothetical protein
MRIEDVVLLKEVANDLNDGNVFVCVCRASTVSGWRIFMLCVTKCPIRTVLSWINRNEQTQNRGGLICTTDFGDYVRCAQARLDCQDTREAISRGIVYFSAKGGAW